MILADDVRRMSASEAHDVAVLMHRRAYILRLVTLGREHRLDRPPFGPDRGDRSRKLATTRARTKASLDTFGAALDRLLALGDGDLAQAIAEDFQDAWEHSRQHYARILAARLARSLGPGLALAMKRAGGTFTSN